MITLYTTHCPKCEMLERKIIEKHIEIEICEDVDLMCEKGLTSAPALEVDGKLLNFKDAIKFINNLGDEQ